MAAVQAAKRNCGRPQEQARCLRLLPEVRTVGEAGVAGFARNLTLIEATPELRVRIADPSKLVIQLPARP
jgi:hypothetical protein